MAHVGIEFRYCLNPVPWVLTILLCSIGMSQVIGAKLETRDFWQVQLFTKYLTEDSYWFQVAEIHCASSCKKGFIVKNQGYFMAPQKKMKWQPTPVSVSGKPHAQRRWWGTVHSITKSETRLRWLSMHAHLCKHLPDQNIEYFQHLRRLPHVPSQSVLPGKVVTIITSITI